MDALQFAYWLQGFSELQETPPTAEQWQSIREHLKLVFNKVTPPVWSIPGQVLPVDKHLRPLRSECAIEVLSDRQSRIVC